MQKGTRRLTLRVSSSDGYDSKRQPSAPLQGDNSMDSRVPVLSALQMSSLLSQSGQRIFAVTVSEVLEAH